MQVFASPRRFWVAGVSLAALVFVGAVLAFALAAGRAGTLVLAGPVCIAFLAIVTARALRTRLEVDAAGGTYFGLVRTRSWTWPQVRHVGRQTAYSFGSTGSTPEVLLRGGRHIVLVGLSNPRHPDAEDALIASCRDLHEAAKDASGSVAARLVAMLTDEAATGGRTGDRGTGANDGRDPEQPSAPQSDG